MAPRTGSITVKLLWVIEDPPDNMAAASDEVINVLDYLTNKGTRSEHGVEVLFGGIDYKFVGIVEAFEEHSAQRTEEVLKGIYPDELRLNDGDEVTILIRKHAAVTTDHKSFFHRIVRTSAPMTTKAVVCRNEDDVVFEFVFGGEVYYAGQEDAEVIRAEDITDEPAD